MSKYDAQWRKQVLARLAAERSFLWWQYWGLDENTLSTAEVTPGWTAKDILAHVASWDAVQVDRISKVVDGRFDEIPLYDDPRTTARNAEIQQHSRTLSLETAMAMALKERSGFLACLERIPDKTLHRRLILPSGWRTQIRSWVIWRWQHDAAHSQEMQTWRKTLPKTPPMGPKYILRALFKATRREFLAFAALLTEEERTTRPVCGTWTLKDLLGHLTDWEKVGVDAMKQLSEGHTPELPEIVEFDPWNNANAAARKDQPWEHVWHDFTTTREQMMALVDAFPEAQLGREFITPWHRPTTVYRWLSIWPGHEHEHGVDIRLALGLSHWPKRLH